MPLQVILIFINGMLKSCIPCLLSAAGAGCFGVCGRTGSAGVGIGVAAAVGTPPAPCSPTVSLLSSASALFPALHQKFSLYAALLSGRRSPSYHLSAHN